MKPMEPVLVIVFIAFNQKSLNRVKSVGRKNPSVGWRMAGRGLHRDAPAEMLWW